jgi:phenylpropionate dioxygenase-like ring-hydroxylating dioxygenase large terminal subunit
LQPGRDEFLTDFWYAVMAGRKLKPGKMKGMALLGAPVVVGRRRDGALFALHDVCPHRAMPLHHGRMLPEGLECCYHGWIFDCAGGQCISVPALPEGDPTEVEKIRVRSYPCRESQGLIWIYFGTEPEAEPGPVPQLPGFENARPKVVVSQVFPCNMIWAVIGLMDPAHASYVHTSWWWRTDKRVLREKKKQYEPAELGFKMARFPLKSSARPYKLLGSDISTEIRFQLPGLRFELTEGSKHRAGGLTTITPIDANSCIVNHCLYWTVPGLDFLRPIIHAMVHQFLDQDRDVATKQQGGLKFGTKMMFLGDADQEAKWYFQLKREWLDAGRENRPFHNPVQPKLLHWRS